MCQLCAGFTSGCAGAPLARAREGDQRGEVEHRGDDEGDPEDRLPRLGEPGRRKPEEDELQRHPGHPRQAVASLRRDEEAPDDRDRDRPDHRESHPHERARVDLDGPVGDRGEQAQLEPEAKREERRLHAARATSTSSKYSPARRPVRRFTWRR